MVNAIAVGTALFAFCVRLYWTLFVQNPLQALYSDMGGYYGRALDFVDGRVQGDPRTYAFFPWGAHVLMGIELWIVGRSNATGIAIVQSIVGTVPAVCAVYFTARVVKSRFWIVFAGLTAALWQPSVVHAGFFMSELWYSAFLVPGTLYLLRFLEGRGSAFRAGFCLGMATIVRPQVLLTFALVGGVFVVSELARPLYTSLRPRTTVRGWGRFAVPLVIILGFSAVRFHHFTNHWGLVSENGPINRVFGSTHVGRVESFWNYRGARFGAWYTPPAKTPVRRQDAVSFEGYIGEEAILDRIREEHYARESSEQHRYRMVRNTQMLIYRHIFPEDDFAMSGNHENRAELQRGFRAAIVNMVPLAFFGLFAMLVNRRQRLLGILFSAHAVTIVVVAALYFAEARMRMPYDPFIITGFVAGGASVFELCRKLYHLTRERPGTAH